MSVRTFFDFALVIKCIIIKAGAEIYENYPIGNSEQRFEGMSMNMGLIDWSIVVGLLVVMIWAAHRTKKYTRSVADFLAANRCTGRYVLGVSDSMAGVIEIMLKEVMIVQNDLSRLSKWAESAGQEAENA